MRNVSVPRLFPKYFCKTANAARPVASLTGAAVSNSSDRGSSHTSLVQRPEVAASTCFPELCRRRHLEEPGAGNRHAGEASIANDGPDPGAGASWAGRWIQVAWNRVIPAPDVLPWRHHQLVTWIPAGDAHDGEADGVQARDQAHLSMTFHYAGHARATANRWGRRAHVHQLVGVGRLPAHRLDGGYHATTVDIQDPEPVHGAGDRVLDLERVAGGSSENGVLSVSTISKPPVAQDST